MGIFNDIDLVLQNEFPNNNNHAELLSEFYAWLDDEEKNMVFAPIGDPCIWFDLCNNKRVDISEVLEYWCQHIKKGIHNEEGFVIKQ